jgi:hypothetical protein
MSKRWISGAVIVGWLLGVSSAQAQYLPTGGAPGPMPEPTPCGSSCIPNLVEGPISPQAAPKGPSACCDLPGNLPGAFDECPPDFADCCCKRFIPHFWVSAEYLHWWFKDSRLPPLLTVGSTTNFVPGAITQSGTLVSFPSLGGNVPSFGSFGGLGTRETFGNIDDGGNQPGGRFTVGFWFNHCETFGLEANYLVFSPRPFDMRVGPLGTGGSPIVARPVFDVSSLQERAFYISLPGGQQFTLTPTQTIQQVVTGTFDANLTHTLWGAEANLIGTSFVADCWRLDFLAGGRYIDLEERLDLTENVTDINGAFPGLPGLFFTNAGSLNAPGTNFLVDDRFQTRNRFSGGQIGFRAEARCCRLYANLTGKIAMGVNQEEVQITGFTQMTVPGAAPSLSQGGLLALPTNIGTFSRSKFTVVPELTVNVGYHICGWMRIFVGYNLFHMDNVVRPGDQIDRVVNLTQTNHLFPGLPFSGLPRPGVLFQSSDFWAQGVNLGVEFRF